MLQATFFKPIAALGRVLVRGNAALDKRFRLYHRRIMPVAIMAVFGVVGSYLLLSSFAASPYISIEPESAGSRTGNLNVSYELGSSGQSVVWFGFNSTPPLPADPLAIACQPTAVPPNPFVGGITYSNWTFDTPGVSSIKMQIEIGTRIATDAALYFQAYDGEASNGQGYYMGVQSSGIMLFSSFGNIDQNNLRTSAYSYKYAGTYEGPFLSLRVNMGSLPADKYIMRVSKAEFDGVGDWYDLYATSNQIAPGQEVYLGGMRFPRTNASQPVYLRDWGGSWVEYYGLGNNPVPYYYAVFSPLEAKGVNGEALSTKNVTFYFRPEYPNSDIRLIDWAKWRVEHQASGFTRRCHQNGNVL